MAEITNFKDLLGDAYQEDLSQEELEKLVIEKYLKTDKERADFKTSFDKASREVADYKKKQNESLNADEKAKAEQQEQLDKLVKENEKLQRELNISKYKANYLAQGYDDNLATETAEAMADGNIEKVFANENKHLTSIKKQMEADAVAQTPTPTSSEVASTITQEEFGKMGYSARLKLQSENPTLFMELSNNENAKSK